MPPPAILPPPATRTAGPGSARVVDLFALTAPRRNRVARRAYLAAINGTPGLWSASTAGLTAIRIFPRHLWLLRAGAPPAGSLVRGSNPRSSAARFRFMDSCSNGSPARPAGRALLQRRHRFDQHQLALDAPRLHRLVRAQRGDRRGHARHGCARGQAARPRFSRPGVLQRARPRPRAARPRNRRDAARALYHPLRRPPRLGTARRLLAETDWELTFAVGSRRTPAPQRLEQLAAGRRIRTTILGWTDEVPRLLMTHHVVISKAGGATTQEAIAARCPMLVNQVVPGQEEGNYELLRRRHGTRSSKRPTPLSLRCGRRSPTRARSGASGAIRARTPRPARRQPRHRRSTARRGASRLPVPATA
jgi:processive 1,2-diacylglycerol beta-glucosyltransferase